jgi:thiol-disulfide isomerase/thioredoxin
MLKQVQHDSGAIVFRILALIVLLSALPALAAPAPHLAAQSFNDLAKPLPLPYDEKADAEAAVKAAMTRARTGRKLLLIDLGGNWCPDCRILAGTMELPQLKAFLRRHYQLVTVDIGRYDRNMQIPARYGIARPEGVPALLVIDPKTNTLLNPGRTSALADARSMTPQALADWLAQWTR